MNFEEQFPKLEDKWHSIIKEKFMESFPEEVIILYKHTTIATHCLDKQKVKDAIYNAEMLGGDIDAENIDIWYKAFEQLKKELNLELKK